jgi:hypothetical protein
MTAAVASLAAARSVRHSHSPAKVPLSAPIRATMAELKDAVRWREDAPTEVDPRRFDEIVGVTALHLGFCALGGSVELDLGNGHVLVCTVRPQEAACAG